MEIGSTAWHTWRNQGLGSSDAPVIMNVSPWKTPLQLYEEKLGLNYELMTPNFIQSQGIEAEPKVRRFFESLKNKEYSPQTCAMNDFKFLRASLDGRDESGDEIIEIKLSGREDWELAKSGTVPAKYYPQIQHQLMVSGARVCFYLSYLYDKNEREVGVDNIIIHPVELNPDYVMGLLGEELKFWELIQKRTPPPVTDRDYKKVRIDHDLTEKWKAAKAAVDLYTEELEKVRAEILLAADMKNHPRLIANDIRFTKITRSGSVDYSKIEILKGLDLNKYRKNPVVSWRIEELKKEKL